MLPLHPVTHAALTSERRSGGGLLDHVSPIGGALIERGTAPADLGCTFGHGFRDRLGRGRRWPGSAVHSAWREAVLGARLKPLDSTKKIVC